MFLLLFLISTICSFADVLDSNVYQYFGYSNTNGNQLVVYTKKSGGTTSYFYRYFSSGSFSIAASFPSGYYDVGAMDPDGNVLIIDTITNSDWNLYFYNKINNNISTATYPPGFSSSLEKIEYIVVKSNNANNFQVVFVARYSTTKINSPIFTQREIVYLNIDTSSGSATVTNRQIINEKKSLIYPIDFNLDPSGNILIAYLGSASFSRSFSQKIDLAYKNFSGFSFTKTSYSLPEFLSVKNTLLAFAMSSFSKIKRLKGINQQVGGPRYEILDSLFVNYNTLSSNSPWSLTFLRGVDDLRLCNLSFNQTNFSSGMLSTILNDKIRGDLSLLSSGNGGTLFFWWRSALSNYLYYNFYDFNQKSTATTLFSLGNTDAIESLAARNNSFFTGYTKTPRDKIEELTTYPLILLLSQPTSITQALAEITALKLDNSPPQLFPNTDTSTTVIYVNGNQDLVSEVYGN
jgi:hypothetical protein